MNKQKLMKIITVGMLIFVFFGTTVYAGQYDINKINIAPYFLLTIILLQLMMIGLYIVLIMTYINFKKKMKIIDKIAEDKKINENVINIRKYNDEELLDMLYTHIDEKFNELSEKDKLD